MGLRSKLSVGFVLSLAALYVSTYCIGSFILTLHSGCICSIIRFRYIDGLVRTQDFFWTVVNVATWSTIEAGACIAAGCIATLRPLFKYTFRLARGSSALSDAKATPLSRSKRSTQLSCIPKSTHSSSTPHYDIALAEIDRECYVTEDKRLGVPYLCEPMSAVSLARTGDEAATLSSDIGNRRTSTEPILGRPELAVPELSWHYGLKGGTGKEAGKKQDQSVRGSWSFVKDTVVDTASKRPRPTSAPASHDCYGQV